MSDEKDILGLAIEIYVPGDFDWMRYEITRTNSLTYHHIISRRYGPTDLRNCALLTKNAHCKLNRLYHNNPLVYDEWQVLFRNINDSMAPPTEEHIARALELRYYTQRKYYGKEMNFK